MAEAHVPEIVLVEICCCVYKNGETPIFFLLRGTAYYMISNEYS